MSYTYSRGRLTSIPGFLNGIVYHLNGVIDQLHRTNGTTDYQRRDPNWLPRPAEIYAYRDSDAFGLWTTGIYQYDGSGNVWKMGNSSFVYDDLSRLTSGAVRPGAYSDGTLHTQSYTFDVFGNIQSITTQDSLVNTPTATSTNRLTAGTYDAAGNLTAWSGNSYEYDAFNQMTRHISSGEDWRYIYTADDERFWAYKVGGGGSLWTLRDLAGKVARQYNAHLGWASYRDYVHRGSTLFATADSTGAGGAILHLHPDHLGTPRLITDTTGSPATATFHSYYPFGEEIAGTYNSSYTEKLRFTGHERDLVNAGGQGDDLDYMHARHCSPITGRFFSFDPAGVNRRVPQSWNRYTYALGNPTRYIDPNGESLLDVLSGFGDAVGSNLVLGLGRDDAYNSDFGFGQALGDVASILLSAYESLQGAQLSLAGLLCEAGSAGACSPAAIPTVAAGAALTLHGVLVVKTAANNLGEGISLQLNDGPGSSGGNLKTLNKKEVDKLGIDAHSFKEGFVGSKAVSKFNIATDSKGNVYLVTLKKGKGVAIKTGLTLDQVASFYPTK